MENDAYIKGVFKITLWMDGTQCGNFRIFLSLRFYVKSILEHLEVFFLPIFVISGILKFVNLLNVSLQKRQKNHKKPNSEPLYGLEIRIAYFESLDSPTLISRKILVTRKIL